MACFLLPLAYVVHDLPRQCLVLQQPLNGHMRIYVTPGNGHLGYSSVLTILHAAAKITLVCRFWGHESRCFLGQIFSPERVEEVRPLLAVCEHPCCPTPLLTRKTVKHLKNLCPSAEERAFVPLPSFSNCEERAFFFFHC